MSKLVSVLDFEEHAKNVLPRPTFDFYRGAAGQEESFWDNRRSFQKFKLRPRFLRKIKERDLSTVVLGQKVSIPIGIAPASNQKLAHPEGECATAKAAQTFGTIFTLSTVSNCSIEEVAQAAPDAIKWFQIYVTKDRNIIKDLVLRAEKAGFKALVLTIDHPVMGIRLRDLKNSFTIPASLKLSNFQNYQSSDVSPNEFVNRMFDFSISWEDIKWLKSITKLPLILKGVMTAEDAALAVQAGVAALQVSNHGARQIDGTSSTIEALPEIVRAVGDKIDIYFDGGVTNGTDVLKALALGAKMVFIGRPALWGLAHSGQAGVEEIFNILKKELSTTLALAGYSKINEIGENVVVHESYYSKL